MAREILLEYRHRPSLLAFLACALHPSPGLAQGVPPIVARWRHRPEAAEVTRFQRLSGLPAGAQLPLLYPHTFAFPLQMAVLAQPAFPLPIWRLLQIRNRIVQHAPLPRGAEQEYEVRLAAHRILAKGVEFDLHTRVQVDGRLLWESLNTFYARGRFGAPTAPALPPAPKVSAGTTVAWRLPSGGGWHYGRLSGDYNPLHLWRGHARRRGYARAFFHPQRVLGYCLARLPHGGLPLRLETWLKGPVFYGAPVALHHEQDSDGIRFALHVGGEARPAIVGRLRAAAEENIFV